MTKKRYSVVHRFHVVVEFIGNSEDDYSIVIDNIRLAMEKLKESRGVHFVENMGYNQQIIEPLSERTVT